jgi:sugar transferase (PEP-CTERM/EpsH1 system associated)
LKILYLCQRVPFPPDSGDRILTYNQIRHLGKNHRVIVGSLAHRDLQAAERGVTGNEDITLIAPDHSRRHRMLGLAWSLLKGKPLTLGHFRNQDLASKIDSLLQSEHFDVILVFSSSMAQYVEHIRHVPRIMHFCDVDSQKWMDLAERHSGLIGWIYQREGGLLLDYERRLAAEWTACCVVTDSEAELFRRHIPGIPVNVIENGVDAAHFAGFSRKPAALEFLFLGVMDYWPNIEAVAYFAERVWPAIVAAHPGARFLIVGSKPARAVRRLSHKPGIEVTGYVPDIRPYLCSATLLIAPLDVAHGVQNKILEAMASGVPVLTTPVVAKGLPRGSENTVFVADREPSHFASTLLELTANPQSLEDKAAAAREYVRQYCTWDSKLQALDQLIEKLAYGN